MANEVMNYDYSELPKAYKITSVVKPETADDAGNRGVKEVIGYDEVKEGEKFDFLLDENGDFVKVTKTVDSKQVEVIQVVVTRKYKNTARVIQFYKTNDFIVLNPGDSVTVEAKYSAEAAYYESLAGDEFTVEVVKPTASDSNAESKG